MYRRYDSRSARGHERRGDAQRDHHGRMIGRRVSMDDATGGWGEMLDEDPVDGMSLSA
jgi:hypothetical protein